MGFTEQAHTVRDGVRGRIIRTKKPGGPAEPQLGVSALEAANEAGSQSVGQKKKKKSNNPANWKQLLLLGPWAAARVRSVATVTMSGTEGK